jgi:hypothetical protein
MKKTGFSLQENFTDDGSIAAEINRKLNLGYSITLQIPALS